MWVVSVSFSLPSLQPSSPAAARPLPYLQPQVLAESALWTASESHLVKYRCGSAKGSSPGWCWISPSTHERCGLGQGPDSNRFLKWYVHALNVHQEANKRANVSTLCEDQGTVCAERQLSQVVDAAIREDGACPKVSGSLPCNRLRPKGTRGRAGGGEASRKHWPPALIGAGIGRLQMPTPRPAIPA